jgi:uncharacterized protein YegL
MSDAPANKRPAYLPVYLVIDTSGSMDEGNPPLIDIANQIVPAIVEVCEAKPAVRDKLRLSLVTFASDAKVVVPLGTKDDFIPIPVLKADGGTEYSKAFRLLATEIEAGVRSLKTADVDVYRPVVFMVTDGEPTDSETARDQAFDELKNLGNGLAPHIVVFGVADASPDTLKKYVNRGGKLVMARSGADASKALSEFVVKLVSTIVQSTVGGAPGAAPAADGAHQPFQFMADDVDDDIVVFD